MEWVLVANRRGERENLMMKNALAVVLLSSVVSSGCGVVAAPCRIGSALIKMVPIVGHPAAVPTDTCAEVIDPTPAYLEGDEDRDVDRDD